MNWKDTSQIVFYIVGAIFSVFSIYSIYQARRQYRRSLRQRTAESLMELEQRFAEFKDILPLIDPESQRYEQELQPTVDKSLKNMPQARRSDKDRRLILRLDQLLRFLLLLTSLEKYDLLKAEALQYMYFYWFNSLKRNEHLKSYVDQYFPTLAAALEADSFSPTEAGKFFIKESLIRATPERVFDFHQRPDALEKLIPPTENARVIKQATISEKDAETIVEIKLFRLFRSKWVARHTFYKRPQMFVDVQVKGPFRRWQHRHIIRASEQGTLLRDEVVYEPPLRAVGRALAPWLIERRLQRLFEYRHRITRESCEKSNDEQVFPKDER